MASSAKRADSEMRFSPFAFLSSLFLVASLIGYADAATTNVSAPKGLVPCEPNDPVVAVETRVAGSIGGQFLNCFKSEKEIEVRGAVSPFEYAFAIRLAGNAYTTADLDKLRSTVTAQWKDFKPLSGELPDNYTASLNALIRDETSTTITSIKPVLVSINPLDANSYSVVSIRSYVFSVNGGQVNATKVNADAIVLRGRNLVRLTMQRTLSDVSDVAQLETEISDWARATEEKP